MITIKRKFGGVILYQHWFFNSVSFIDCLRFAVYKQLDLGTTKSGLFIEKYSYTLQSDLTLSTELIVKKFSSTLRNEINRSEREGCNYNPIESINNFISVYNDFALQRGINGVSKNKLTSYGNSLLITSCTINGVIVAVHGYLLDRAGKRVRLLYSGTQRFSSLLDRNLISRSNKFLHYKDMLKFKQDGYNIYDWGGIAYETKDIGLQGINKFKESFGGELVRQKEFLSFFYYLILKIFKS